MKPKEVKSLWDSIKKSQTELINSVIKEITDIIAANGGDINVEENDDEFSFDTIGYEGLGYLADSFKIDGDGDCVIVDDTKESWYIGDVTPESIIGLHAYLYRIGMATRPVSSTANNPKA